MFIFSEGESLNFSSQLRPELHCALPIQHHVFLSCDLFWYHIQWFKEHVVAEI